MGSLPWSPLRIARPLGLLSGTRTQLRPTQLSRASLYHYGKRPGVRLFSVSIASATGVSVQETVNAIVSIHATTHIPWFLMIPCLAIGINAIARLPFNIYTTRISQRQTKSSLVMRGWSWRIAQDMKNEGVPRELQGKERAKRFSKAQSRIYRAMGTQKWKLYSSGLGLPGWLIGIECIRQICGGPRGLLGRILMGPVEDEAAADIPSVAAGEVSTIDPSTASTVTEKVGNLIDPSIALEGCLWFPDLSVADPYHILPFALSAMLVTNIMPKGGISELFNLTSKSNGVSAVRVPTNKWQLRLRRGMVGLACLIGPCTADMPVALHFYWLTSAAMSYATNKVLGTKSIKAKQVERCKGAEANVIRPQRTGKAASQIEKKDTEQMNAK
ncbi:hypothetical protein F4781DRAFT_17911 [Annulohypoxylon bovei var. microspora]|nr:hypothetical protein F4781DRAFT_17911 [Annulohypoxylon bovei var. microspora]